MLTDVLTGLAVSGSAAAAVCLLLRRAARGRLSARWEYRMAKLSLVFALVPLGQLLPWTGKLVRSFGAAGTGAAASAAPARHGGTAALPAVFAPADLTPAPAGTLLLPRWLLLALAAVWLAGALWLLVRRLRARQALMRLVRSARPAAGEDMQHMLLYCRGLLGLKRQAELRTSAAVRSPLVTGVLHPVILLPEETVEPQDLKCLLLHELNHVRRRDLWVRLCSAAALIVHWYNPLFHMLDRTVREVGEERCDEDVAQLLDRRERLRYGQMLLQMAAGNPGQTGPWALCLSSREALERRLSKMLHTTPMKGRKRLAALLAGALVLTCGTAAALTCKQPLISAAPEADAVQTPPASQAAVPKDTEKTAAPGEALTDESQKEPVSAESASRPEPPSETALTETEEVIPAQPETSPQPVSQSAPEQTPELSQELRSIMETAMETALRGDTDLIVRRGGTLLPDDDLGSYCQMGDVYYKMYVDKNGFYQKEYFVGNQDALRESRQLLPDTLVDGVFPTNSLGETYGTDVLSAYVGYAPDLVAARGTNGGHGYICRADEQFVPHDLPAAECPHEFAIPLYDSEHNVIGEFHMSCGGHFSGGMTIEEAKEAVAAGEELT